MSVLRLSVIGLTAVVVAAISLVACVAVGPEYYGPYKLKKMSKVEQTVCLMEGGEVYVGGIFPTELCALPATDAGKFCQRASDCDSYCESDTKTCSKWHMGSGCYDYLNEDGIPESICID